MLSCWSFERFLTSASAATGSVARTRAELSTSRAVKIGAQLVEVGENLAVGGAAGRQTSRPLRPNRRVPKCSLLAQSRLGKALGDGRAHHHLAAGRSRTSGPRPASSLSRSSMPIGRQTAHVHIDAIRRIDTHQVDHGHHFERRQRLPGLSRAIPGLDLRSWKASRVKLLTSSESAPLRSTRTFKGLPVDCNEVRRPVQQGQNRQQHGHGERDTQRRHDGGGLADHKVAEIVCDRNRHK